MRLPRARCWTVTALITLALLGLSRGQEDDPDFDDDVDLEDVDSSAPVDPEGAPPVEDFDLGMPETDRKKRMSACYIHVMNLLQYRRDRVEATVKELLANYKDQVTQEQATNSVVFSWMMSCYMNIDDAEMKEAILGKEPTPELEQSLYAPRTDRPQQVPQASKRQWTLLQEVLQEQQKDMAQRSKPPSPQSSPGRADSGSAPAPQPHKSGGPMLSGLSGQSQAIYVLVVFGAIFGLSSLGVMRLMRSEKEGRERHTKKEKKAGRKKQ